MAVLEGGLLFRSTFASAGAHRWSIPTPVAQRSEHPRGVLCCCALSIIRRFLVEHTPFYFTKKGVVPTVPVVPGDLSSRLIS